MRLAFELFSDIFTYRDNGLTRVHPCVKVVTAFLAILALISTSRMLLPALVFCCASVGMVWIRLPMRCIIGRLAAPMGIVVVLLVLQSLMVGSTPLFTLTFREWRISAMEEGVRQGLLTGSRVLASVSVVVLLSSCTPAHRIFHTLRRLGVPKGWVEVAMLMYRYVFIFVERTAEIMTAQRVRLGYGRIRKSLSSLGMLAGSVLVLSMEQALRTHEAMTMRGYTGTIPLGPMTPMTRRDWWILAFTTGLLVFAYVLIEWGLP